MKANQKDCLMLCGTQIDLCISEIKKSQYENWERYGFSDDSEDYISASESTYECQLVPDAYLSLFVNDTEVSDLHQNISDAKNFYVNRYSYKRKKNRFYLITKHLEFATYYLWVTPPFDFKKLVWRAELLSIPLFGIQEFVSASYDSQQFEYSDGRRVDKSQRLLRT